jgi:hypothetical protein
VYCPSLSYVPDLVENQDWLPYYEGGEFNDNKTKLSIIVHMTPLKALSDHRYATWIKRFGAATEVRKSDAARALSKVQLTLNE